MNTLLTKVAILGLLFGMTVLSAHAQSATTPDTETPSAEMRAVLQAEIDELLVEVGVQKAVSTPSPVSFPVNLGVGATGPEVMTLQKYLVEQGFLVMPVDVKSGYFGELTQRAVSAWQSARGISPASGYWGPISRDRALSIAGSGITVGGEVVAITLADTTPAIATPDVEGSIVVSLSPRATSAVPVLGIGSDKLAVLELEFSATSSDMRVERVTVELGTNEGIYKEILAKIHLMDGSALLATRDLGTLTGVVEANNGTLSTVISGLNFVVEKGTSRVVRIVAEARYSINSVDEDSTWTLSIPTDGVRAVDGTGTNRYAPAEPLTGFFQVKGPTL